MTKTEMLETARHLGIDLDLERPTRIKKKAVRERTIFPAARMKQSNRGEIHARSKWRQDERLRDERKRLFPRGQHNRVIPAKGKRERELQMLVGPDWDTDYVLVAYRLRWGILNSQFADSASTVPLDRGTDGQRVLPLDPQDPVDDSAYESQRRLSPLERRSRGLTLWGPRTEDEKAIEAGMEPFLQVGPAYGHDLLTPSQAEVVDLVFWRNRSLRQASEMLGRSESYAQSQLTQAKAKLRKRLRERFLNTTAL
jgi:hypothetical protein